MHRTPPDQFNRHPRSLKNLCLLILINKYIICHTNIPLESFLKLNWLYSICELLSVFYWPKVLVKDILKLRVCLLNWSTRESNIIMHKNKMHELTIIYHICQWEHREYHTYHLFIEASLLSHISSDILCPWPLPYIYKSIIS
jgi:hypothetical protein